MGAVVIVSLPMIVFFILLCFASYRYGRKRGQEEGRLMAAQEMGMIPGPQPPPIVPPLADVAAPGIPPSGMPPPPAAQYFPSPTPYNHPNGPAYVKQEHATGAF